MENAFTFKTIISSSLGKRKSKRQYCENRAFYDNIYTIKTDILYISIQSLFTLDFFALMLPSGVDQRYEWFLHLRGKSFNFTYTFDIIYIS